MYRPVTTHVITYGHGFMNHNLQSKGLYTVDDIDIYFLDMNPSFYASILLLVSIPKIGYILSLASYGLRDLVCMKIILLCFFLSCLDVGLLCHL
jgi:hypothetical protein